GGYGLTKRFGLIYVDFEMLELRPKGSYKWYRDIIRNRIVTWIRSILNSAPYD
ncbi:family 1 glycosylhydrolase, partial [Candidatus Bipolaricaulota bacterium]|nr:family 1 glycosylhydrolase [Candidatus Bipolaricaulota bacterium]